MTLIFYQTYRHSFGDSVWKKLKQSLPIEDIYHDRMRVKFPADASPLNNGL